MVDPIRPGPAADNRNNIKTDIMKIDFPTFDISICSRGQIAYFLIIHSFLRTLVVSILTRFHLHEDKSLPLFVQSDNIQVALSLMPVRSRMVYPFCRR